MKRCRTSLNLVEMEEQVQQRWPSKRSRSTPDLSALRRAAQEAGHAPPATLAEFLRLPRTPLQDVSPVSCLAAAAAAAPGGGAARGDSPRTASRTLRFAPPAAGEGDGTSGPARRWELADGVPSLVHSGSLNELVILEHPSQEDDESTGWPTTISSYGTAATADADDCRGGRAFETSEDSGSAENFGDAAVEFSDCLTGAPCDGYGVFCDIAEAEPEALQTCQTPPRAVAAAAAAAAAAGGGGCSGGGCSGGATPEQVGWWIDEAQGNFSGNFNSFRNGSSSEAFSTATSDVSDCASNCRRGESPERERPSVGQPVFAAPQLLPAAAAAGRRHVTAATLASDLASLLRLGRLRFDGGGGRPAGMAAGVVAVPMPVLCEGAA